MIPLKVKSLSKIRCDERVSLCLLWNFKELMIAAPAEMTRRTVIQMCANRGLLDCLQYVPAARVLAVTTQMRIDMGTNCRTPYHAVCMFLVLMNNVCTERTYLELDW